MLRFLFPRPKEKPVKAVEIPSHEIAKHFAQKEASRK